MNNLAAKSAPAAVASVLAMVAPSPAQAQIVNVHPLIAKRPDLQGPSFAFEGSLDSRSGNTDLLLLSGLLLGSYREGRHFAFALARADYGSKSGDRFISSNLEHVRYRVTVVEPFALETFGQHERNEFRRLALRTVAGLGPFFHVGQYKPMDAGIGVAYMFEHEELADDDKPDAGEVQNNHRLSTYLSLTLALTDRLGLGYVLYAQPRFDDFADIRVLSDTEFAITAAPHVAFKINLTLTYDTRPPISVKPIDVARKASLQVSF